MVARSLLSPTKKEREKAPDESQAPDQNCQRETSKLLPELRFEIGWAEGKDSLIAPRGDDIEGLRFCDLHVADALLGVVPDTPRLTVVRNELQRGSAAVVNGDLEVFWSF